MSVTVGLCPRSRTRLGLTLVALFFFPQMFRARAHTTHTTHTAGLNPSIARRGGATNPAGLARPPFPSPKWVVPAAAVATAAAPARHLPSFGRRGGVTSAA